MHKKYNLKNFYIFFLFALMTNLLLINLITRDKFHDVTIELGDSEINENAFVVSNLYLKRSSSITDLDSIDLNEVGEYDVKLTFGDEEETVKLKIVDTTAPEVDFQDLVVGLDYKFNVEDFVLQVRDLSDYEIISDIESLNIKVGEYKINVIVRDIYGNETSKECKLDVRVSYNSIDHELSEPLTKDEILLSPSIGDKELTDDILKSVDVNEIGEYKVKFTYRGTAHITKVTVKDTVGPKIVVNNIDYYLGKKEKRHEDFVKEVSDPSGIKDVKYDGVLDYKTLGVQELKIIATDNLGNVSETSATLTVKNDNVGPKIYGLDDLTVRKGEKPDYLTGVKGKDKSDGECEVTVDYTNVNLDKLGTYYATYTSKDLSNNITTKKRKIIVIHSSEDVDKLFDEFFDKNLKGKSIMQMTKYIRTHIRYSHDRGDDPIYIALTKKVASCYGHAALLKKALDKAGIPNCIISTNGKAHYWNYVYEKGSWRHYDSNPGVHPIYIATDKAKLRTPQIAGRTFNKSECPAEAQ